MRTEAVVAWCNLLGTLCFLLSSFCAESHLCPATATTLPLGTVGSLLYLYPALVSLYLVYCTPAQTPTWRSMWWCTLLWVCDVVLSVAVVHRVPYTEIDWRTYMQQVALILQGERDYALVAGDTGPLVYPAGHVWVFSALSALTAERVSRAQLVFLGLYLVLIGVVLRIYRNTSVPSFVFPVLILSRRIHSIFMLRLFNDCWAMTVCWLAIWCFCLDRWTIGCLLYSFAVSIKMNILLFAPGLFVLLLRRFGAWKTVIKISLCALVQLVLGFPFLSQFPKNYIKNSFDLGRVFMYKWTVNWKILPEDIFVSKSLAVSLLVLHIVLVALFAWKKWIPLLFSKDKERTIPKESILYVLFTSNLIGIACARSLHFQFYVWYFHSLPFLLWKTSFFGPTVVQHLERILLLFCIEVVWNVFPSRAWTSALLQVCHGILLIALWRDNNRAKATKALKTE